MPKFRKKPIIIEATQLLKENLPIEGLEYNPVHDVFYVLTLEGPLKASYGDWIITGIKGEHYPCKSDIFADTYESIDGGR